MDEADHLKKIFVGGLNPKTTAESMRAYFCRYGEIVDCSVKKDNVTQRSRGFGFVTYDSSDCVDKVQNERPHILDDKTVDTKRVVPKSEQTAMDRSSVNKIFIGGLKDQVTEEDMKTFFSQFGEVEKIQTFTDKETERRKGFAFITFKDFDAVDKCYLFASSQPYRKVNIQGVKVEVKKAHNNNGDTMKQNMHGGRQWAGNDNAMHGGMGYNGGYQSGNYGSHGYGGPRYGPPGNYGPPGGYHQGGGGYYGNQGMNRGMMGGPGMGGPGMGGPGMGGPGMGGPGMGGPGMGGHGMGGPGMGGHGMGGPGMGGHGMGGPGVGGPGVGGPGVGGPGVGNVPGQMAGQGNMSSGPNSMMNSGHTAASANTPGNQGVPAQPHPGNQGSYNGSQNNGYSNQPANNAGAQQGYSQQAYQGQGQQPADGYNHGSYGAQAYGQSGYMPQQSGDQAYGQQYSAPGAANPYGSAAPAAAYNAASHGGWQAKPDGYDQGDYSTPGGADAAAAGPIRPVGAASANRPAPYNPNRKRF